MPSRIQLLLLAAILLAPAGNLLAQQGDKTRRGDPTIDPILVAAGFLDSHPDLLYRSRGLDAYGEKDHPKAFKEFKRAAWYSDKASQAIVGEMLWIGLGTEKDRAQAYVWMSLAAERGYRSFSEKRDLYWQQLDEAERARAEREGPAIRAEYADAAAEPRLAVVLRRELNKASGSRVGSTTSPVQIVVPGVGTIDSSQYYNPRYWEPKQYREYQDSIWHSVRIGRVDVGSVEQIRDAPALTAPESTIQDEFNPEPEPDGQN